MITERLGGKDFSQLNQICMRQSLPHVDQYHTFCIGESEIYECQIQVLIAKLIISDSLVEYPRIEA